MPDSRINIGLKRPDEMRSEKWSIFFQISFFFLFIQHSRFFHRSNWKTPADASKCAHMPTCQPTYVSTSQLCERIQTNNCFTFFIHFLYFYKLFSFVSSSFLQHLSIILFSSFLYFTLSLSHNFHAFAFTHSVVFVSVSILLISFSAILFSSILTINYFLPVPLYLLLILPFLFYFSLSFYHILSFTCFLCVL